MLDFQECSCNNKKTDFRGMLSDSRYEE